MIEGKTLLLKVSDQQFWLTGCYTSDKKYETVQEIENAFFDHDCGYWDEDDNLCIDACTRRSLAEVSTDENMGKWILEWSGGFWDTFDDYVDDLKRYGVNDDVMLVKFYVIENLQAKEVHNGTA